ncbi:MAG: DUF3598 domain-containing protein [Erythrobacter sp.]
MATPQEIRENMPLLAANEGVWEGVYRYYDATTGEKVDEHKSRLICRIPEDGKPDDYHQTNYYFWEDGKTDFREFPANYKDGRIWFDNDLIKGWAAPMQPDDQHLSQCLNWVRKGEEGLYLYEMIQVDKAVENRARVWHWFRDGKCYLRTLIDEKFVSRDWQNFSDFETPPA